MKGKLLVKRTRLALRFKSPISLTEDIIEDLEWSDLYLYGDLVDNDPNVLYIHDTAWNRIYWGHVGDAIFKRQPSADAEQEMLKDLA